MRNEIVELRKRLISEKRGALATLIIGLVMYIEESHPKCEGLGDKVLNALGSERVIQHQHSAPPSTTDISLSAFIGITLSAAVLGGLVFYWGSGSWTHDAKISSLSERLEYLQTGINDLTTKLDEQNDATQQRIQAVEQAQEQSDADIQRVINDVHPFDRVHARPQMDAFRAYQRLVE